MLLFDELMTHAKSVLADLQRRGEGPWTTAALALNPDLNDPADKQLPYKVLRRLAELGFPGVEKGPERVVVRFGKKQKQRPWVWAQCTQEQFDEWAAKIRAEPAKVGPYSNIEKRLRDLEARVTALEAAARTRAVTVNENRGQVTCAPVLENRARVAIRILKAMSGQEALDAETLAGYMVPELGGATVKTLKGWLRAAQDDPGHLLHGYVVDVNGPTFSLKAEPLPD